MNFQEKLFETTADLRARAAALANVALSTARTRAEVAARRVDALKGSFGALTIAGREFNKVARRHAVSLREGKLRRSLSNAGKDVSALARTTYATLANRQLPPRRPARRRFPQASRPQGRLIRPPVACPRARDTGAPLTGRAFFLFLSRLF